MNCFEGNDCLCLVALYVHMITAYICIRFGHWNSQIFLVSFSSCSGCDWKSQSVIGSLFLNWASALPSFAPLQRKYRCACDRQWCGLCQMWWLCGLFLSQEIWLYFSHKLLTGKCFRGGNFPNRRLSMAVCLCIYPHTVFTGCGACSLAQHTLPLPGYIHYFLADSWSASLEEVTLEISCAQTQICRNILKSAIKNQPLLHSRAVL